MRKAVLISIQPKWCELIASGKKTVEVRKSRPKIDTPFKVYIYCTKAPKGWVHIGKNLQLDTKVIGEFMCKEIEELKRNTVFNAPALYSQSRLTRDEYFGYIGNKTAYIWYISGIKIYDKPRELSEFSPSDCGKRRCFTCKCFDPEKPSCTLKRPPQSWCYVEELEDSPQMLGNASQSIAREVAQNVLKPATPENFELMPG